MNILDVYRLILAVATVFAAGGAAYGGVRWGLRALEQRVDRLEKSVERVDSRVDRLYVKARM